MSELDFTLAKYENLCRIISESYPTVTLCEYFSHEIPSGRFAMLRHDIDRKPGHALRIAAIEKKFGIKATYYFRSIKSVFSPEIIREVAALGHEIGFHYESLSNANGNREKAIGEFGEDLKKFRNITDIKTICMHGRPLSPHDNRDMWKYYDLKDFELLGEAYVSINEGLYYFSDTGRTWSLTNKIRDHMRNAKLVQVDTTDSLIEMIKTGELDRIYILTHPERWSTNNAEWAVDCCKDAVFNAGKRIISAVRP